MSQFVTAKKPVLVFSAVLAVALVAEFVLLEGTLGVSLPKDRNSAVSTLETKMKGTEPQFITRNRRFTVVELLTEHRHS